MAQKLKVPSTVSAPPADPVELARHELIWRLEHQSRFGHSLDGDRALMGEAAACLRHILGLSANDPLLYPPASAPYGPVEPTEPIGHSLPDPPSQD